jgi:hypothetical protein
MKYKYLINKHYGIVYRYNASEVEVLLDSGDRWTDSDLYRPLDLVHPLVSKLFRPVSYATVKFFERNGYSAGNLI